jgi:hypothetical protein
MPPIAKPKEKQHAWTPDTARRRSMRVLLSVPVNVIGKTAKGKDFTEETRTLVVNAHGALVPLSAEIPMRQKVIVTNLATKEDLECVVSHIGTAQAGKTQFGLEFVAPAPLFWKIDFPPDDWVVPED